MFLPPRYRVPRLRHEVVALIDAHDPAEASWDMVQQPLDHRQLNALSGKARSKRTAQIMQRPSDTPQRRSSFGLHFE